MANPRALIVDDEPDICELLSLTLARMGVDSSAVHDLASARRELQGSREFALCLTDLRLPDGDGTELIEWIQNEVPELPVAVITAHGHVESAVLALKLGAFDFVRKPVDISDLRKLINQALKLSDGRRAADGGRRLLGDSEPMQKLRAMIGRVARSQAPVHITGESGTGKELVARLIHESGPRKDAPFVPVSCGAIPSELMESELFGHRRGSFTGAVADKLGLVQAAEGGTLFLDEVADLPFVMQVKLLRLIQEKTARPVGDQREQPVDVRILSATHRDLGELVAAGRFREDLYYRINVIEMRVPSLRDRLADVPELAASITQRFAARLAMTPPAISAEAMELLSSHDYPGQRPRARERHRARAHALRRGDDPAGRHRAARAADVRGFRAAASARHAAADAGRHGARLDPQGPGRRPLQQDGRRPRARDQLPGAALPHQETRHRVTLRVTL